MQKRTKWTVAGAIALALLRAEQVFGYGTGFPVIVRCGGKRSEQVGCNSLNRRHLLEHWQGHGGCFGEYPKTLTDLS